MNRIALTIPSYNCAKQLMRVLEKVHDLEHGHIETILIVDNKSDADQVDMVKNFIHTSPLKSKIKFYQNEINLGLGASFKRSWIYLKNSGHDHMIFLHGDDQADLKDYLNFHQTTSDKMPSIAFGARFMKTGTTRNYSKKRHWVNVSLNNILGTITRRKIWELGSGLNTYKLDSISNEDILKFSNHIAFDLELLIFCIKKNIDFTFFPISWKSEDEVSTINEFKVGLDLLKIMFQYAILNIRPVDKTLSFPIESGWMEVQ